MRLTRRAVLLGIPGAAAVAQFGPKPEEIPPEPPLPPEKLTDDAFAGMSWKPVYTFSEGRDEFVIVALEFVSPTLGFAAGRIMREGRVNENRMLVTSDGGKTWSPKKLPDIALSMFALDETHLWLVTRKNLHFSADAGTKWRKLKLPRNCGRVCFVNAAMGFAFGAGKTFWRTADGGSRWEKVPECDALSLTDENTSYSSMCFVSDEVGMLVGNSARNEEYPDRQPDWMRPERTASRRVRPTSWVLWTTRDGGKTWTSNVTSAFGKLHEIRMQGALGAAIAFYGDGFPWPTELTLIDMTSGKSSSAFRRAGLRVSDILLLPGAGLMLGAVDPLGRLTSAGLPGKACVLYTPDFTTWYQMKVDYRAEGVNVMLATNKKGGYWAATDSGMILQLVR